MCHRPACEPKPQNTHFRQLRFYKNQTANLPRVPLGQGRSTATPLCVCGQLIPLASRASQNFSGRGEVLVFGGIRVVDITGGGFGPRLPSFIPPADVVLTRPFCEVVVVVVDMVVWTTSAGNVSATMVVGTEGTKGVKLQYKKAGKKNMFLVFRGLVHLKYFSYDGHGHLHFLCLR